MKAKGLSFTAVVRQFAGIACLIATGLAQAGDLDDISIQIIGLDQVPGEALEAIPLPPPAAGSMSEMQGDVIFNKPMSPGNALADQMTGPIASPAPGGVGGGGSSTSVTGGP